MELLYLIFEVGLGLFFLYMIIKFLRCSFKKDCPLQ
jgi:hypothetical protein